MEELIKAIKKQTEAINNLVVMIATLIETMVDDETESASETYLDGTPK